MASLHHRQFAGQKYRYVYDDNEGLDYDSYSNDDDIGASDDSDDWPPYDAPGRVKSKKQAMKYARRGR